MAAKASQIVINSKHSSCDLRLDAYLSENIYLTFSEAAKLLKTDVKNIIALIKFGALVPKKLVELVVTSDSVQRYVDDAPAPSNEELDNYLKQVEEVALLINKQVLTPLVNPKESHVSTIPINSIITPSKIDNDNDTLNPMDAEQEKKQGLIQFVQKFNFGNKTIPGWNGLKISKHNGC